MNEIDKDRLYWIDAIRSFACVCVIATHVPISGGDIFLLPIAIFKYLCVAGASILFFMISGALVLFKPKPVVPFLKKRLSRIVFPMVFWTIVSLLVKIWLDDMSAVEFWKCVLMIPFGPQLQTYWFIYMIFGIYLMTPILATWLDKCSKRDLLLYLCIWGFTLLLPYLKILKVTVHFTYGYLYYFYGYLWLAVLGFYIRKYVEIRRYLWYHYFLFVILLLLPFVLYMTPCPHSIIQNRLSINVVALSVCYFVFLKRIHYSDRWKKFLYNFAQHSFGIYLIHILIMRRIIWPIISIWDLNYVVQIPVVVIFTAFCSYCVVKMISFLPKSKYIIGV